MPLIADLERVVAKYAKKKSERKALYVILRHVQGRIETLPVQRKKHKRSVIPLQEFEY